MLRPANSSDCVKAGQKQSPVVKPVEIIEPQVDTIEINEPQTSKQAAKTRKRKQVDTIEISVPQTSEQAVSTPEVQSTEPPKKRGRPCKKPAVDESVL